MNQNIKITKENGVFVVRELFNDGSIRGISTYPTYEGACKFACVDYKPELAPEESNADYVAPEADGSVLSQQTDKDFPEASNVAPIIDGEKTGEVLAVGTEQIVPEPVVAGLVADGSVEVVSVQSEPSENTEPTV